MYLPFQSALLCQLIALQHVKYHRQDDRDIHFSFNPFYINQLSRPNSVHYFHDALLPIFLLLCQMLNKFIFKKWKVKGEKSKVKSQKMESQKSRVKSQKWGVKNKKSQKSKIKNEKPQVKSQKFLSTAFLIRLRNV